MSPLKIGAVSYLNSKPLVHGLNRAENVALEFDLPSRLADRLAAQELDVALIPVIEAISDPTYTIVSNACIACRGPVWSVKLYSRVPFEEIRSVALDEGSRTSAALARIILKQKYSLAPEYRTLPIHQPWRDSKSDAVLVIGDRAMKALDPAGTDSNSPAFRHEWDLGEYWYQWTELPFVFAVWAARPDVDCPTVDALLNNARDSGLLEVDSICRRESVRHDLDVAACRNYLTRNLHFHLGPLEKSGLDLYLDLAREHSVLPGKSEPAVLRYSSPGDDQIHMKTELLNQSRTSTSIP